MSELPLGWVSVPLDAVSNLIRGVTYKKDESADHSEEGYLPVLRANNIQNGKLQFDNLVFVLEQNIKDIQKIIKGDIVVAMSSGSKRLVGKSGIAETDFNGGFGAFCGVLRPSQYLNSKYVGLYTLTKEYSDLVSSLSKGVNINNLKPDHFSEINIPVAPLNEQIRIADKLDSMLANIDAAQARLEKIPSLLKRFRQSLLAAATSGELTREWREENGVSFEHWATKSISGITTKCFDGPFGSKLKTADYTTQGVKVARLENIGHLKFLHEKETFISEEKFESLIGNKLEDMDILFSSFVDEEVRTCIFRGKFGTYINKADCFCLRTDSNQCLPEFLVLRLACKSTFEKVKGQVHGATRPRINLKFLKSLTLPIPGIEEQKEIVRRVESLFILADTVEKQYLETKKRTDRLTQSLLAKAFRGELVPQDPNDEPAAELLKRIQAERNAQPPVKNKRAKSA